MNPLNHPVVTETWDTHRNKFAANAESLRAAIEERETADEQYHADYWFENFLAPYDAEREGQLRKVLELDKPALLAWLVSQGVGGSTQEWDGIERFLTVSGNKVIGSAFDGTVTGGSITGSRVVGIPYPTLNLQTLDGATNKAAILTTPNIIFSDGFIYRMQPRQVNVNRLNTGTDDFSIWGGFVNLSGEPTYGAYFKYSPASTFWQIATANNSVRTLVATSVPVVANTRYTLTVEVDTKVSPRIARFYINGSVVGTITANIPPATAGAPTGMGVAINKVSGGTNTVTGISEIAYSIK